MNALLAVQWPLSETIVERLGWVLVHSLWQFAVLGLIAAIILRLLRDSSSNARHGLLVLILAAAVVAPVATWLIQPVHRLQVREPVDAGEHSVTDIALDETDFGNAALKLHADTGGGPESKPVERATIVPRTGVEASLHERISHALEPWFPWIVGGWCVGVLLCSLRPLIGWRMLRRLRKIGISPPSDEVLAAFNRVSRRLGLRQAAQVLYSTVAKGPLLVGYFRPVVLLPASLVTNAFFH